METVPEDVGLSESGLRIKSSGFPVYILSYQAGWGKTLEGKILLSSDLFGSYLLTEGEATGCWLSLAREGGGSMGGFTWCCCSVSLSALSDSLLEEEGDWGRAR